MIAYPVCLNPFVFGEPHKDCDLSVLRAAALCFAENVSELLAPARASWERPIARNKALRSLADLVELMIDQGIVERKGER